MTGSRAPAVGCIASRVGEAAARSLGELRPPWRWCYVDELLG